LADHLFTLLFVLEAILKIRYQTIKGYFSSGWNKFDFAIVLLSFPAVIVYFFAWEGFSFQFFMILRVARVFKFFRFIKFLPNVHSLIYGVQRAIKASIIVLLTYFICIFIIAVLCCYIYKEVSPEYFGNPVTSFYSIFKVFTIEGWFEIPDEISATLPDWAGFLTKSLFIMILITGGMFGLSLVNSIFVDAMVADNNDLLEEKVDKLSGQIAELKSLLEQRNK
jgi:voltage-gated sodium channel